MVRTILRARRSIVINTTVGARIGSPQVAEFQFVQQKRYFAGRFYHGRTPVDISIFGSELPFPADGGPVFRRFSRI